MADSNQVGDEIIIIGDRVDLVVQTGLVYRAMIEDRVDNGPFLVAVPSRKGIPMRVAQDDDIYLVFYRETGRYIAQMKVVALERRGALRYMWLLQRTPAQKNQRRGAYRLPVSFSVQILKPGEEQNPQENSSDAARAVAIEKADSKDISVTGIALITKKKYEIEDKYILVMQITGTADARLSSRRAKTPPLEVNAAVKRCIPWRVSGKYNTGMSFVDITRSTSEQIAQFVLTEQQRQIRMRRLG